ncbi:MAG: glycosyltransferase family 4 protein, partial [Actinomycetota bacterium]|nr:glycosyltransferase family 4 protein [Actinomycetota bacterium]
VIHEGLSPEALARQPQARAAARTELALPEEAFVCLVVGRLNSWKGQDVLARALAEPPLRERGAIGLVAGDAWPGAERIAEALAALRSRLGLGDRLRLLGFRSDLDRLYGAADVVCVPSTKPEPLGLVALEAAAARQCVVASRTGGLPEIVRDGETGVLVPPGDPAALARALADLAADPDRRARLGAAAAVDVSDRFSVARLLDRVQSLYDELLRPR